MFSNYLEPQLNYNQVLVKIGQTTEKEDLEFLVSEVLEKIRETLEADRVIIYYHGKIRGESLLFGWNSLLGTKIKLQDFGRQIIGLLNQGEIVTNIRLFSVKFMELWEVKSLVTLPIFLNDQFSGLIMVHYCADFRHLSPTEMDILEKLVEDLETYLSRCELLHSQQSSLLKNMGNFVHNFYQKIKFNWAI